MVLAQPVPNIHVIGIYRSKTKITISQLIHALTHPHNLVSIEPTIPTVRLLGDFNIGIMQANTEQKALMKYPITDTQLISILLIHTTDPYTGGSCTCTADYVYNQQVIMNPFNII